MHIIIDEFRNAGFVSFILVFFGAVGLALSLAAIASVAGRSRAAPVLGAAAVGLGAFIALGGMGGAYWGRTRTESALAGDFLSPVLKERIRRVGYAESRSAARLGLIFAAPSILAGAIVLLAAAARRKQAPRSAAPRPFGAPAAAPEPADGGPVLPAVMLSLAGLSIAGATVPLLGPLPGRDLAADDPTWELLEATDEVLQGDEGVSSEPRVNFDVRCARLAEWLDREKLTETGEARADPGLVPDFPKAAARCIDAGIQQAMAGPPEARRAALTSLLTSRLLLDGGQKQRIEEEIARAPAPAPAEPLGLGSLGAPLGGSASPGGAKATVRAGATTVSGRLPPEVIQRIVRQNMGRFRLCYEQGLSRDPKLAGRVTVRFVIGRDGAVSTVSDGGSDLPDKSVVACVTRAFHGLSFPQPEGGIVTVSYPIAFSPG